MTRLTYVVPETPARPFEVGDRVEVLDRQGNVIGIQQVTKVRKCKGDRTKTGWLKTDCDREWNGDGWWLGESMAYPFPSIRHAKN